MSATIQQSQINKQLTPTSLADVRQFLVTVVCCPTVAGQSTTCEFIGFVFSPVPPCHARSVTPRPRRTTRLTDGQSGVGARARSGVAGQTDVAVTFDIRPARKQRGLQYLCC